MRTMLLAAAGATAAMILAAAPAQAQHRGDFTFAAPPGFAVQQPAFDAGFRGGHHDGDRRHRRGHRDDSVFVGGWGWNGGEWAYYNNRSFASDSFNGWWHDRPDRAYPAWVQHNQNCTLDRMWWSGNGWHC